jgi:hypothetical protein
VVPDDGIYQVMDTVEVDPQHVITEMGRSNNIATIPVTVIPTLSDLICRPPPATAIPVPAASEVETLPTALPTTEPTATPGPGELGDSPAVVAD